MTKLLKVEDVAKQLRVTQASVGKYIREGGLKAIRLGGIWRIKEEELTAFIERKSQY